MSRARLALFLLGLVLLAVGVVGALRPGPGPASTGGSSAAGVSGGREVRPAPTPHLRGSPVTEPTPPPVQQGGLAEADGAVERAEPGLSDLWLPPFPSAAVTVLDAWNGRLLAVPTTLDVEVLQCMPPRIAVYATAPEGYVAWDDVSWCSTEVLAPGTPRAETWEVVVPLRREVEAWVTVRRADGRALEDARIGWGFDARPSRMEPVRETPVRVRGIPFFAGALVVLAARDGTLSGLSLYGLSRHPDDVLEAEIVLRPPVAEPSEPVETNEDLPFTESVGRDGSPGPPGDVEVVVRRRDGAAAAHVLVEAADGRRAMTDEHGRAVLTGLAAGPCVVGVRNPGFVPVARSVEVPSGGMARLDLVEPEGGTLEIDVSKRGVGPLPFAPAMLRQPSGVPWTDLEGGRQRLDRFTDDGGRKTFRHVEPGTVVVEIVWGDQRPRERFEVREGEVTRGRIELP